MEYTVISHGDQIAVIAPAGRLDAATASVLKDALKQAVANNQNRLVLDLARVNFIDSSGLSALVSGLRLVKENGGGIVLSNAGPQIRVAMELTRLTTVFHIYDNTEDALAGFSAAGA
ncbi:MAG: STAS domain-containing protein [Anaerolineae bacterium]|nr:STAS domain-containing protein [Anaerolineae bacterium]